MMPLSDQRASGNRSAGGDRAIQVLMAGPAPSSHGGIATVIRGYLEAGFPSSVVVKPVATWRGRGRILDVMSFATAVPTVTLSCLLGRCDILHLHSSQGGSFIRKSILLLIGRITKTKVILHINGSNFDSVLTGGPRLGRRCASRVLSAADLVIVVSEEWRLRLAAYAPSARIKVIPNGVHLPSSVWGDKRGSITSTGMLGVRKGSYTLVRAAAQVERRFVLAGNGDIDGVRDLARVMGVSEKIDTPGWLSPQECTAYLSTPSVYALPTRAEGLPLGLLEAMAHGLPVVTSRAGGIPSLIEDGVNGLLVPTDDPDELARAINAILGDESLRRKLGKNARATIEQGYAIDTIVKSLTSTYEDLLAVAAREVGDSLGDRAKTPKRT